MTATDTTVPSQADSISFEFDLQHPPGKVWLALTDPVLLGEWLLPVLGLPPRAGGGVHFQAPPQPGWDGIVNCRVLELEPQKRLRYSWIVGDMDNVVTFTLAPTASGTRLSLVQSGFKPKQKRNFNGARYGWKMMGRKLVDLLMRIS